MRNVSWAQLKDFSVSRRAPMQYFESENGYDVIAIDGYFAVATLIDKTSVNADRTDFETNFKAQANQPVVKRDMYGREISTNSPFTDASGFRFRGAAFSGSSTAAGTFDIDYRIAQERYINGGRLLVDMIGADDRMTFQVVDKDNVLGMGAGVVLDEFISEYYVPQDGNLEVRLDYPARIMAGLYLRLRYTSTSSTGCTVKCNLYLHWKSA